MKVKKKVKIKKKQEIIKNREWERDRRGKLNATFSELGALLPDHDPSQPRSKIATLVAAIAHIRHLVAHNARLKDAAMPDLDKLLVAEVGELQSRIETLRRRCQQLAALLQMADIPVPVSMSMQSKDAAAGVAVEMQLQSKDAVGVVPTHLKWNGHIGHNTVKSRIISRQRQQRTLNVEDAENAEQCSGNVGSTAKKTKKKKEEKKKKKKQGKSDATTDASPEELSSTEPSPPASKVSPFCGSKAESPFCDSKAKCAEDNSAIYLLPVEKVDLCTTPLRELTGFTLNSANASSSSSSSSTSSLSPSSTLSPPAVLPFSPSGASLTAMDKSCIGEESAALPHQAMGPESEPVADVKGEVVPEFVGSVDTKRELHSSGNVVAGRLEFGVVASNCDTAAVSSAVDTTLLTMSGGVQGVAYDVTSTSSSVATTSGGVQGVSPGVASVSSDTSGSVQHVSHDVASTSSSVATTSGNVQGVSLGVATIAITSSGNVQGVSLGVATTLSTNSVGDQDVSDVHPPSHPPQKRKNRPSTSGTSSLDQSVTGTATKKMANQDRGGTSSSKSRKKVATVGEKSVNSSPVIVAQAVGQPTVQLVKGLNTYQSIMPVTVTNGLNFQAPTTITNGLNFAAPTAAISTTMIALPDGRLVSVPNRPQHTVIATSPQFVINRPMSHQAPTTIVINNSSSNSATPLGGILNGIGTSKIGSSARKMATAVHQQQLLSKSSNKVPIPVVGTRFVVKRYVDVLTNDGRTPARVRRSCAKKVCKDTSAKQLAKAKEEEKQQNKVDSLSKKEEKEKTKAEKQRENDAEKNCDNVPSETALGSNRANDTLSSSSLGNKKQVTDSGVNLQYCDLPGETTMGGNKAISTARSSNNNHGPSQEKRETSTQELGASNTTSTNLGKDYSPPEEKAETSTQEPGANITTSALSKDHRCPQEKTDISTEELGPNNTTILDKDHSPIEEMTNTSTEEHCRVTADNDVIPTEGHNNTDSSSAHVIVEEHSVKDNVINSNKSKGENCDNASLHLQQNEMKQKEGENGDIMKQVESQDDGKTSIIGVEIMEDVSRDEGDDDDDVNNDDFMFCSASDGDKDESDSSSFRQNKRPAQQNVQDLWADGDLSIVVTSAKRFKAMLEMNGECNHADEAVLNKNFEKAIERKIGVVHSEQAENVVTATEKGDERIECPSREVNENLMNEIGVSNKIEEATEEQPTPGEHNLSGLNVVGGDNPINIHEPQKKKIVSNNEDPLFPAKVAVEDISEDRHDGIDIVSSSLADQRSSEAKVVSSAPDILSSMGDISTQKVTEPSLISVSSHGTGVPAAEDVPQAKNCVHSQETFDMEMVSKDTVSNCGGEVVRNAELSCTKKMKQPGTGMQCQLDVSADLNNLNTENQSVASGIQVNERNAQPQQNDSSVERNTQSMLTKNVECLEDKCSLPSAVQLLSPSTNDESSNANIENFDACAESSTNSINSTPNAPSVSIPTTRPIDNLQELNSLSKESVDGSQCLPVLQEIGKITQGNDTFSKYPNISTAAVDERSSDQNVTIVSSTLSTASNFETSAEAKQNCNDSLNKCNVFETVSSGTISKEITVPPSSSSSQTEATQYVYKERDVEISKGLGGNVIGQQSAGISNKCLENGGDLICVQHSTGSRDSSSTSTIIHEQNLLRKTNSSPKLLEGLDSNAGEKETGSIHLEVETSLWNTCENLEESRSMCPNLETMAVNSTAKQNTNLDRSSAVNMGKTATDDRHFMTGGTNSSASLFPPVHSINSSDSGVFFCDRQTVGLGKLGLTQHHPIVSSKVDDRSKVYCSSGSNSFSKQQSYPKMNVGNANCRAVSSSSMTSTCNVNYLTNYPSPSISTTKQSVDCDNCHPNNNCNKFSSAIGTFSDNILANDALRNDTASKTVRTANVKMGNPCGTNAKDDSKKMLPPKDGTKVKKDMGTNTNVEQNPPLIINNSFGNTHTQRMIGPEKKIPIKPVGGGIQESIAWKQMEMLKVGNMQRMNYPNMIDKPKEGGSSIPCKNVRKVVKKSVSQQTDDVDHQGLSTTNVGKKFVNVKNVCEKNSFEAKKCAGYRMMKSSAGCQTVCRGNQVIGANEKFGNRIGVGTAVSMKNEKSGAQGVGNPRMVANVVPSQQLTQQMDFGNLPLTSTMSNMAAGQNSFKQANKKHPNTCSGRTKNEKKQECKTSLETNKEKNNAAFLDDIRLALPNNEFSNDLFTSLQVPSGSQHHGSLSPTTAAFLLAFPLVSNSKNSEMLLESENTDVHNSSSQSLLPMTDSSTNLIDNNGRQLNQNNCSQAMVYNNSSGTNLGLNTDNVGEIMKNVCTKSGNQLFNDQIKLSNSNASNIQNNSLIGQATSQFNHPTGLSQKNQNIALEKCPDQQSKQHDYHIDYNMQYTNLAVNSYNNNYHCNNNFKSAAPKSMESNMSNVPAINNNNKNISTGFVNSQAYMRDLNKPVMSCATGNVEEPFPAYGTKQNNPHFYGNWNPKTSMQLQSYDDFQTNHLSSYNHHFQSNGAAAPKGGSILAAEFPQFSTNSSNMFGNLSTYNANGIVNVCSNSNVFASQPCSSSSKKSGNGKSSSIDVPTTFIYTQASTTSVPVTSATYSCLFSSGMDFQTSFPLPLYSSTNICAMDNSSLNPPPKLTANVSRNTSAQLHCNKPVTTTVMMSTQSQPTFSKTMNSAVQQKIACSSQTNKFNPTTQSLNNVPGKKQPPGVFDSIGKVNNRSSAVDQGNYSQGTATCKPSTDFSSAPSSSGNTIPNQGNNYSSNTSSNSLFIGQTSSYSNNQSYHFNSSGTSTIATKASNNELAKTSTVSSATAASSQLRMPVNWMTMPDPRTSALEVSSASSTYIPRTSALEMSSASNYVPRTCGLEVSTVSSTYIPRTSALEVSSASSTYIPRTSALEVSSASTYIPRTSALEMSSASNYVPRTCGLEVTSASSTYIPRTSALEVSSASTYIPRTSALEMSSASTFVPDRLFTPHKDVLDFIAPIITGNLQPTYPSSMTSNTQMFYGLDLPSDNQQCVGDVCGNKISTSAAASHHQPQTSAAASSSSLHYSWPTSKSSLSLLSHLDSHGLGIPSTLPTLVGDLALGTNTGPSTPAADTGTAYRMPSNATGSIFPIVEGDSVTSEKKNSRASTIPSKPSNYPLDVASSSLQSFEPHNTNALGSSDTKKLADNYKTSKNTPLGTSVLHQASHSQKFPPAGDVNSKLSANPVQQQSGSFLSVSQLVDEAKADKKRDNRNSNNYKFMQNVVPPDYYYPEGTSSLDRKKTTYDSANSNPSSKSVSNHFNSSMNVKSSNSSSNNNSNSSAVGGSHNRNSYNLLPFEGNGSNVKPMKQGPPQKAVANTTARKSTNDLNGGTSMTQQNDMNLSFIPNNLPAPPVSVNSTVPLWPQTSNSFNGNDNNGSSTMKKSDAAFRANSRLVPTSSSSSTSTFYKGSKYSAESLIGSNRFVQDTMSAPIVDNYSSAHYGLCFEPTSHNTTDIPLTSSASHFGSSLFGNDYVHHSSDYSASSNNLTSSYQNCFNFGQSAIDNLQQNSTSFATNSSGTFLADNTAATDFQVNNAFDSSTTSSPYSLFTTPNVPPPPPPPPPTTTSSSSSKKFANNSDTTAEHNLKNVTKPPASCLPTNFIQTSSTTTSSSSSSSYFCPQPPTTYKVTSAVTKPALAAPNSNRFQKPFLPPPPPLPPVSSSSLLANANCSVANQLSSTSSSTNSLANFNMSTIFPEMNDKVDGNHVTSLCRPPAATAPFALPSTANPTDNFASSRPVQQQQTTGGNGNDR